jgi:hypothetical protein
MDIRIYDMAIQRYREDFRRGEAGQRLDEALGARTARVRLAAALTALAARLNPAVALPRQEQVSLTPADQA